MSRMGTASMPRSANNRSAASAPAPWFPPVARGCFNARFMVQTYVWNIRLICFHASFIFHRWPAIGPRIGVVRSRQNAGWRQAAGSRSNSPLAMTRANKTAGSSGGGTGEMGEMAEWLKAHAWKACILQKGIEGSNPSLSATFDCGRRPLFVGPGPVRQKQIRPVKIAESKVAEREGFEPSIPFWSMHAFQACAFNHSAISPISPVAPPRAKQTGGLICTSHRQRQAHLHSTLIRPPAANPHFAGTGQHQSADRSPANGGK